MDVKRQPSKPSAAVGKKRKKKEQSTIVKEKYKSKQSVKTEVKVTPIVSPAVLGSSKRSTEARCLPSASVTRKLEDQAISSSSGSSIDSHKPYLKQKRCSFDYSRPISCSASSNLSKESFTSDASKLSEERKGYKSASQDTDHKKVSIGVCLVDIGLQSDISVDTLRWEHELSDEELEKARIDEYKEKRRQRYIEAMASKKEHLPLSTIRTPKAHIGVHTQ